jgi:hypothetical protein
MRFPLSPHQTVHELFPHTAFLGQSSDDLFFLFASVTSIVSAELSELCFGACSRLAVTKPFPSLLTPHKSRPFAPAEFCCLCYQPYYDRVPLPPSSTPFRFLVGIVSSPVTAGRGEGLLPTSRDTDVFRSVSPLIPRREQRLSFPYLSNHHC